MKFFSKVDEIRTKSNRYTKDIMIFLIIMMIGIKFILFKYIYFNIYRDLVC